MRKTQRYFVRMGPMACVLRLLARLQQSPAGEFRLFEIEFADCFHEKAQARQSPSGDSIKDVGRVDEKVVIESAAKNLLALLALAHFQQRPGNARHAGVKSRSIEVRVELVAQDPLRDFLL